MKIKTLARFILLSTVNMSLLLPLLAHADKDVMLEPTPSHVEGLYYKTASQKRNVLVEKDMKGTRLFLKGRVLSKQGKPVPGVRIDFWQADAQGRYDTKGSRLRGHQFSDEDGHYWLETIVPASYLNRTPHIHVSLKLSNERTLTTQLFFPNDPHNRGDSLYKESLLMTVHDGSKGKEATFDFILDISD